MGESPDRLVREDHRFAWRWLVPMHGARTLHPIGLSPGDAAFLRAELRLRAAGASGANGSLCVVDADAAGLPGKGQGLPVGARTVCVFGRGFAVERWRRALPPPLDVVREYALIPGAAPTVVVPLGRPSHTRIALNLHRPGRWAARVAVALASQLVRLGSPKPLRRTVLLVATRGAAIPHGAERCAMRRHLPGSDRGDYALYAGSPSEERKTVVLPLQDGLPAAIVKIATLPRAVEMLRRELQTLRALRDGMLAPYVPRCLSVHDADGVLALYEEYRPRRWAPAHVVGGSILRFLALLAGVHRGRGDLDREIERLDHLRGVAATAGARLAAALRTRAAGGAVLWKHRSHGDFAPWNCSWTKTGLVVYDWEASSDDDVAFSDAFHFSLAPARLVGSWRSPAAHIRSALAFATRVAMMSGLSHADVPVHFACWLIRRLAVQPVPFHLALAEELPAVMASGEYPGSGTLSE